MAYKKRHWCYRGYNNYGMAFGVDISITPRYSIRRKKED